MRWALGVVVAGGVAALAWWLASRGAMPGDVAYPIPGEDVPYTVEVLNATTLDGLARDVTARLRRRGLDVVSFGSASESGRDSTLVLVRRGDSAAGAAVRQALGFGRVLLDPDPPLLLDVTVLLGTDAALDRHP